jgi:hypothetical protein
MIAEPTGTTAAMPTTTGAAAAMAGDKHDKGSASHDQEDQEQVQKMRGGVTMTTTTPMRHGADNRSHRDDQQPVGEHEPETTRTMTRTRDDNNGGEGR